MPGDGDEPEILRSWAITEAVDRALTSIVIAIKEVDKKGSTLADYSFRLLEHLIARFA
jgi:hypothetical protein